jgi:acyl-CoA dehydrogenase
MSIAERAVAGGPAFSLTDEQRALRELAHDFAEKEIRPKTAEYDVHMTHPADVLAKAHTVGLMNLHIPAEYGGAELSLLDASSSPRS